jgi:ABC-type branched-subunit amino acid transport system substrate-binding protein
VRSRALPARLACALALCLVACVGASAQSSLTPQESRGRQIYLRGTSPAGGEILAYVGEASLEVPGDAMACANCHGLDGRGKPESGVTPSNLTWEALTKPYGVTRADGRRHPPYTERGLELAITRGTDPAGNRLLNVMPRYSMSREDLADLVAYMKRLGKDVDPGVGEDRIVVGTAAPARGALAEMGQAIKAVTAAYFDELNSQGGLYNRRVELKFVETAETPAETRANFERFLKDEQVFAMTGAFIAGAEKEVVPLMARQEVPLVGPLTLYPQTGFPLNRQVFYLLSGLDVQSRALLDFAAKRPELKKSGVAVVYPSGALNAAVVEAVRDQSKKGGLGEPHAEAYERGRFDAAETVKRLRRSGREAVLFLGSGEEAQALLAEADKLGWFPTVLLPGAGAGVGVFGAPAGFEGKVFLSFPTTPYDQSAQGLGEFRALAAKYKLPPHHLAAQLSAYSAAKILTEALRRTGRDLSRERLIAALEGLYEYQTGLTPAITYGPNRRVGASGAYVVTADLKERRFLPASGWISIN